MGLFFIRAKKQILIYEFKLPKYAKILTVFYIFILERVDPKMQMKICFNIKIRRIKSRISKLF